MPRSTARRAPRPARIRVRMYQVGFGDCFLLSVEYDAPLADGRAERHVLIDFGTTSPARGTSLRQVAGLVKQHTYDRLDVVVVSHRHKDHISGFAARDSAPIIDQLRPGLIVRPWTEQPDLPADARALIGALSRQLVDRLAQGQRFADAVLAALGKTDRSVAATELRRLALAQLSNQDAIDRLDAWARAGRGTYVHYGSPSGIDDLIPGLRTRVLGPPTVEQWASVRRRREDDPVEFWMLRGLLAGADPARRLGLTPRALARRTAASRARDAGIGDDVPGVEGEGAALETDPGPPQGTIGPEPGPERWLIDRMHRQRLTSSRRIVRTIDAALNNTSVILLFQVGSRRLLFGGDAQIESWEYALNHAPDRATVRRLLGRVDLYKVGHHGSRNATPRSLLFKLWADVGGEPRRPMTALLSTRSGVHGRPGGTEVPRVTLVNALRERMTLHSTEDLAAGQRFIEVVCDTSSDEPFEKVAPA